MRLKLISISLLALLLSVEASAQNALTKDQILNMSIEELSDLPLEDLMQAVETLGVSSVDELFAMIMNKNVSSASKETEDSFVSPLSSTVITREEMRTYGVSSIEEALRLIPGMIVTQKANGVFDVQVRGLNNIPDNNSFLYTENANTLLLIDGRPAQNYAMGSLDFDFLPIDIEDIAQIEVVRGACSALYGATAVNGVINIITEKPSVDSKITSGNVQFGSQGSYNGNIAIRKAISDKFAFGITANMMLRDRNTNKIHVMPNSDLVMTNSKLAELPPMAQQFEASEYQTLVDSKAFINIANGGEYSIEEINNIRLVTPYEYVRNVDGTYDYSQPKNYMMYNILEPEKPITNLFRNNKVARDSKGVNGYISITPAKDVRIDLTGGYQQSYSLCSPIGDEFISFNARTSKTGYINLIADVKDINVRASYMTGPQDFSYGTPGFKELSSVFNGSASYSIKMNNGLHIVPAVEVTNVKYEDYVPEYLTQDSQMRAYTGDYTWNYKEPGHKYDDEKYMNQHLSGFFNYDASIRTVAPSIKFDYKVGDFRAIVAYRAEKTSVPDTWTHSLQVSANYKINDNNFVRFVYGKGNRGSILINSKANYEWTRTNLMYPDKLQYKGNKDADIVKINNFELGYRWNPVKNILVDAEAFYSISTDYGALMADMATLYITQSEMSKLLYIVKNNIEGQGMSIQDATTPQNLSFTNSFQKVASISFQKLPYEVHQMGVGINIDYIISSKLIAKVNANWQQTKIDKYYDYSQDQDIAKMLAAAGQSAYYSTEEARAVLTASLEQIGVETPGYVKGAGDIAFGPYYNINTQKMEFTNTKIDHKTKIDPTTGEYKLIGTSENTNYYIKNNDLTTLYTTDSTINGHKHKATPSIYGMVGLIYKPIQQLNVSAFANFTGKRTYKTKFGTEELNNRCTVNMKVGYKPTNDFEVYFNAQNLFNQEKREFTYSDKIGGIYSIGLNFEF